MLVVVVEEEESFLESGVEVAGVILGRVLLVGFAFMMTHLFLTILCFLGGVIRS
jgi:hypothetical protein